VTLVAMELELEAFVGREVVGVSDKLNHVAHSAGFEYRRAQM
jgi:hypothetical protein